MACSGSSKKGVSGRLQLSATGRSKKHPLELTSMTDVVATDAFQEVSAGGSAFRVDNLLELRRLFDKVQAGLAKEGKCVQ